MKQPCDSRFLLRPYATQSKCAHHLLCTLAACHEKNNKGHDLRGCCHNDNPFVSSIFNADFFSWNRQLFFPSVNINCPFKLFQNFISSLKFYRIIKHRIRFHYRETLLRGLPLCLACSSIWLVNSEMTEFQSCSEQVNYKSNERVVTIVTSITGRPHNVFGNNNCWHETNRIWGLWIKLWNLHI